MNENTVRSRESRALKKLAAMSAEQKAQYRSSRKSGSSAERDGTSLPWLQNTAEALKVLADKGIRPGLVKFVVAADAKP